MCSLERNNVEFDKLETGKAVDHQPSAHSFGTPLLAQFPLEPRKTHLNHGSFGCAPLVVEEARDRRRAELSSEPDCFIRWKYDALVAEAHDAICNFLSIPPKNTVFVDNAITGMNTVLKSVRLGPGDAILLTDHSYGGVVYACESVCARAGCRLVTAHIRLPRSPSDATLTADEIVDDFEQAFVANPDVRLAVIDLITCPTAILMPVLRLIELAHRHGVMALVDGAHGPGHVPPKLLSEAVERADFFTGSLSKWGFVSRTCAILCVHPKHQGAIEPLVTSWYHPMRKQGDWQAPFHFFGTHEFTSQFTVFEAIQFYKSLGGLEAVQEYNKQMADEAQSILSERLNPYFHPIRLEKELEAPFMRLFSVPLVLQPQVQEKDWVASSMKEGKELMQQLYYERDVMVHLFPYPTSELSMRVSAQVYNTRADYIRAADALLAFVEEREHQNKI